MVQRALNKINLLITGSGGREHALAFKSAQSARVDRVFVAPGNAGTALEPGVTNVDIDPMDFDAQIAFVRKNHIALTIIGPEAPLVAGVVDRFQAAGLVCFGPTRLAAQLEGSKRFAKAFLNKYGIPTAACQVFTDADKALAYLEQQPYPQVIKADGLAAGKGVVIVSNQAEAESTVRNMLSGNILDGAGRTLVIEEFLVGEEASFIVIADGENYIPFASSQDHKAACDGDRGPNTGGMGAYSPAPVVTGAVHQRILDEIITPTLDGMSAEGHPYTGFLYAGVMIDATGAPSVIEFNCRFGDPETQPVMARMKSDLAALCLAAVAGDLAGHSIEFDPGAALTVVLASGGYPGDYDTGKVIEGLARVKDARVFHAGTRLEAGEIQTAGGRVLGVTALGDTVAQAQDRAYAAVRQINFERMHFRTDIGYRAVARETDQKGGG